MKLFYSLSSGKLIMIISSNLLSINFSNYCHHRPLFSGPKTVQASVTLLDQLPIFMDKSRGGILHAEILPMLYMALESSMSQVQMAAVSVVPAILDYVGDEVIRAELLPRARKVHSTAAADVKIVLSLLACVSKVASQGRPRSQNTYF